MNETGVSAGYTQAIGTGNGAGALYFTASGNPFFQLNFATNGFVYTSQSFPSSTGWVFYAGTWSNGSSLKFYKNGILVNQTALFSDTISAVGSGFWMGRYSGGSYFPGLIDNVRIYNRALSASEIQAMYNGGK